MLLTLLQNILKILLFAALFSLEISVALPITSLLFIYTVIDRERMISQGIVLVCSSLIVSSFVSLSWSLVSLVMGVAWVAFQHPYSSKLLGQQRRLILSCVTGGVLANLSHLTFNYKTAMYTILFMTMAVLLSRALLPRKMKRSVIDWIAPQQAG